MPVERPPFLSVYKAELAAWLSMELSGAEWNVLMTVALETWGTYGALKRDKVEMTVAELSHRSGCSQRQTVRATLRLRGLNVLGFDGGERRAGSWWINRAESYSLMTKMSPDAAVDSNGNHLLSDDKNVTRHGTNLVTQTVKSGDMARLEPPVPFINTPNKRKKKEEDREEDTRRNENLDVNAKGLRPLATPTLPGHVDADTVVGEGASAMKKGNARDVPTAFDLYNTGVPVHHVSPEQSAAWIAEVIAEIKDKTALKGIMRGNVAVIETIVDHTLTLSIRNGIFVEKLNEPAFKDPLTDAFENVLGERHKLNIVLAKGGAQR